MYCSDEPLFPRTTLRLKGRHNGAQSLRRRWPCWTAWAWTWWRRRPRSQAAVRGFQGLPHRLAEIEDPSGLTFVDDTLSTSPYSAMHAIDAYEGRPLTVLVGGTDRGLDYAPLRQHLQDRELTVIGIPDSGPRILAELAGLPGRAYRRGRGPARGRASGPRADTCRGSGPAVAGRAQLRPVPQLRAPFRGLRRGDPRQRALDPTVTKRHPRVAGR